MTWQERFDEIQDEWEKHRTANTCSICDSPKGHTDLRAFIAKEIEAAEQRGLKKIATPGENAVDLDHAVLAVKATKIMARDAALTEAAEVARKKAARLAKGDYNSPAVDIGAIIAQAIEGLKGENHE